MLHMNFPCHNCWNLAVLQFYPAKLVLRGSYRFQIFLKLKYKLFWLSVLWSWCFYLCYNLISISKLKYKEYKLSNSRWFIGHLTHCKFFKNADCRYFYNTCYILLWLWILAYWSNGFFHTFQRTPRQDILLKGRRTSEYNVSFENSLGNHQPYITMFWKHLTKHHKALFGVMNVCFSI